MKYFNKNTANFMAQNELKIRKAIDETIDFIDGYYTILLRAENAHNKIPKLSERKNGKFIEISNNLKNSLHKRIEFIKQECLMELLSYNPIIK